MASVAIVLELVVHVVEDGGGDVVVNCSASDKNNSDYLR